MIKKNINMRILFFLSSLELGGSERQAFILAEHLQKEGYDIQVWGFEKPGKVALLCDEKKIIWKSCPYWKGNIFRKINLMLSNVRNIRKFNPNIIIPFGGMPSFLCAVSWRFTKARICIWGERDIGLSRFWYDTYPFAIKLSSCVVTNSKEGEEYIRREYDSGLDIRVINNGVYTKAPKETREKWRELLKAQESTLVYCMVANLSSLKNHSLLISAWYKSLNVSAVPYDSILVLAGREDDMTDSLKQQVSDYGINDKVRFLGQVDDISGLLTAVDVGVLSSLSEGQSNAILEYMYAGLPIIASDLPSTRELLDNTDSCLFKKDSVEELVESLKQMVSVCKRKENGLKNAERCKQLYFPERMFASYKALFNDLLKKRRKRITISILNSFIFFLLKYFIYDLKMGYSIIIKLFFWEKKK